MLDPILSFEQIYSGIFNTKNLEDSKNILIFISPSSIKLFISIIDNAQLDFNNTKDIPKKAQKFSSWLRQQIIYVPGESSKEKLAKYGLTAKIGAHPHFKGVIDQIKHDNISKINISKINLLLLRGENSSDENIKYLNNQAKLNNWSLNDLVFYKQVKNHNYNRLNDFIKKVMENIDIDINKNINKNINKKYKKIVIFLPSLNGVRAFISSFIEQLEVNKVDIDVFITLDKNKSLNFYVMNKESVKLLQNFGFGGVNII